MTLRTEPIEIVTEMSRIYPNFFADAHAVNQEVYFLQKLLYLNLRTFLNVRSLIL